MFLVHLSASKQIFMIKFVMHENFKLIFLSQGTPRTLHFKSHHSHEDNLSFGLQKDTRGQLRATSKSN